MSNEMRLYQVLENLKFAIEHTKNDSKTPGSKKWESANFKCYFWRQQKCFWGFFPSYICLKRGVNRAGT